MVGNNSELIPFMVRGKAVHHEVREKNELEQAWMLIHRKILFMEPNIGFYIPE